MFLDPHYVPYGSLNFDEEYWRQFQTDKRTLDLAEQVKDILSRDLIAAIPIPKLEVIGWDVAAESGMETTRMQYCHGFHWASVAICILAKAAKEDFFKEDLVRFYKSEYDNSPYLRANIAIIADPKDRWGKNVLKEHLRKSEDEAKAVGPSRYGENNKTHGTARGRASDRNETRQGSLFDLY